VAGDRGVVRRQGRRDRVAVADARLDSPAPWWRQAVKVANKLARFSSGHSEIKTGRGRWDTFFGTSEARGKGRGQQQIGRSAGGWDARARESAAGVGPKAGDVSLPTAVPPGGKGAEVRFLDLGICGVWDRGEASNASIKVRQSNPKSTNHDTPPLQATPGVLLGGIAHGFAQPALDTAGNATFVVEQQISPAPRQRPPRPPAFGTWFRTNPSLSCGTVGFDALGLLGNLLLEVGDWSPALCVSGAALAVVDPFRLDTSATVASTQPAGQRGRFVLPNGRTRAACSRAGPGRALSYLFSLSSTLFFFPSAT